LLSFGKRAQYTAQRGNIDRQVALFHKAVRPHLVHEFVLSQQAAVALDQDKEDVK
jgi:hypothetical protein